MDIRFLYLEDCPNWQLARARLDGVLSELAESPVVQMVTVTSPEEAGRLGFRGSPTILVDGVDVLATGDTPVGLSCRIYQTPDGPQGSPSVDQLRSALTRS